jgi:hypothetical protein
MVAVIGMLVSPTPVVGKAMAAGATWMPEATAPVPLRITLAWFAIEADATVNAPVNGPVTVGVNTTPTAQLAAAARLDAHVFCVKVKPVVTESASELAAELLVLLTVTVCVALDVPTMIGAKVSSAGFTFRPVAILAAPFKGTETGFTPRVAEETTRDARLPPALAGVKVTCTVQFAPLVKVAAQVVAPVAKLLAFSPVISNPTLAAETAPVLPIVSVDGALATPTSCPANVRLAGLTLNVAGLTPVPDSGTCWVRSAS